MFFVIEYFFILNFIFQSRLNFKMTPKCINRKPLFLKMLAVLSGTTSPKTRFKISCFNPKISKKKQGISGQIKSLI